VHPQQQRAFTGWIGGLDNRFQEAVVHAIEKASADVYDATCTKSIKQWGLVTPLREIKLQSRGIHLRLIYLPSPFQILAFGLRRDLEQLIANARRLITSK
jgi:hypothetical protein